MATLEAETMKLWILLALLLQAVPGSPSPQYATAPYSGDLITLQYRELSYRLSRFVEPDPARQFMSGYIYSGSSPVTHSDPTGAMMGGETVEMAIRDLSTPDLESDTEDVQIIHEEVSHVPPPSPVATLSRQTESMLSEEALAIRNTAKLRYSIWRYRQAVPIQEKAAAALKAARDRVKLLESVYNSKRTTKHYWINQVMLRASSLSYESRDYVIRRHIQDYGLSPEGEYTLRGILKTPKTFIPPTMPVYVVEQPVSIPQPTYSHIQRYQLPTEEFGAIDLSGFARQQRSLQRAHPYARTYAPSASQGLPPQTEGPYE
ncbi:hypothetical protein [Thiolapillus sp.]|uniref:hypothetical protein n=8 Tax=Thiolapillus sp. TaxID=2017437 RepID=UPI003AF872CB